ncbi:hypothetical protein STEG23_013242, partial [Scotinomys teguina]
MNSYHTVKVASFHSAFRHEEHSVSLKLTSLIIKSTEITKYLTITVKGARDTFKVLEFIDTCGQ